MSFLLFSFLFFFLFFSFLFFPFLSFPFLFFSFSYPNNLCSKMVEAQEGLERLLDLDRCLHFPSSHPHTYDDKYSLAGFSSLPFYPPLLSSLSLIYPTFFPDFLGIGTIASVLKIFSKIGNGN